MLSENGIASNNGFNSCAPIDIYQPCPSDYELAPAAPVPIPGWRNQHPKYVHHVEWVDGDNRKHGLTLRTDDREEMLETLRCVKATLASAQQPEDLTDDAPEPEAPAADEKPKTKPCPVCAGELLYLKTGKDGGQWYSHKLADGGWCRGK